MYSLDVLLFLFGTRRKKKKKKHASFYRSSLDYTGFTSATTVQPVPLPHFRTQAPLAPDGLHAASLGR